MSACRRGRSACPSRGRPRRGGRCRVLKTVIPIPAYGSLNFAATVVWRLGALADDTLRVTLLLKTIEDLFREPDLSPFDPYYAPHSFAAGMDYLVGEMQRRPRATRTEFTVLLPPEQIAAQPGLEARTREAIGRYAEAWATSARQTQDTEGIRARRVLAVAVLFFAVANLAYLWYGRTGSVLGYSGILLDVVVEGLSVAAWVVLWWPLDQLLHVSWQHRQDERAYRTLQDIDLQILPDPTPPASFTLLPLTPS